MRRSSIITIILLVLVIIGLTVALVVTNLPEKDNINENNAIENNEKIEDKNEFKMEEEKPKETALNSQIAIDIATLLDPGLGTIKTAFFYEFQGNSLNQQTMSDFRKLQVAYIKGKGKDNVNSDWSISKAEMDKAMIRVFGNTNYKPQDFNDLGTYYEYDDSTEIFKVKGNGGGGQGTHIISGVYKINEYSDRYEVYAKALVIESDDDLISDKGYSVGRAWNVLSEDSTSPDYVLERYFQVDGVDDGKYNSYERLDDIVKGITAKEFVQVTLQYGGDYSNQYKLLTKYYDDAMEYKHTFIKSEDGSYYWTKTERIFN